MLTRAQSHPFPFRTPAMEASLYLNLLVHQNLKVHFFAVRASTTRLRCETYSTFDFLSFWTILTTLMVFTCFRCDVANYHRKVRRTGDGLQTKHARNHNPFFLASIDYVWNDPPLFSSEKINLIHTRTKTNFQIKIQSFAF